MKKLISTIVVAVGLMIATTASAHHTLAHHDRYNHHRYSHHEDTRVECTVVQVFPGIFIPHCQNVRVHHPRHQYGHHDRYWSDRSRFYQQGPSSAFDKPMYDYDRFNRPYTR